MQNARSFQKVTNELSVLQDKVQAGQGWHTFIGESRIIKEKLGIARKAAETDSSVLLLGESGVGKELFAEQIHLASPRSAKPFIRVNCAAIPEALLESELFGHVKGAFTDAIADREAGSSWPTAARFSWTRSPTCRSPCRPKLLRVIQSRTFERVGSSESMQVNVRIIAATNHKLEREVAAGRFRADLFYRLNVLPIHIPPLRERTGRHPAPGRVLPPASIRGRRRSSSAVSATRPWSSFFPTRWPGNVRELENAIERAVVFSRDERIRAESLTLSAGRRARQTRRIRKRPSARH